MIVLNMLPTPMLKYITATDQKPSLPNPSFSNACDYKFYAVLRAMNKVRKFREQ
jgi:hypothetical protein